jgi:hypothetical protein
VKAAWAIALLANAVSLPTLFFVFPMLKEMRLGPVLLMFPVIGAFLLYRAIRLSLELRKFGVSNFVMSSIPGVVGGKLEGFIDASFDPRSARAVSVKLTCIHRTVRQSSEGDSIKESIVWQDEQTFETGQVLPGPSGCRIPVLFQIPFDALETNINNMNDAIQWRLSVTAEVPGIDYAAQFDVPVFRTRDSSLSEDRPQTVEPPKNSRIRVQPTPEGVQVFLPAARNPGLAMTVTFIFLIWSAGTWFLTAFMGFVALPFTIIFAAIGVGLFVLALTMWFATGRVLIERGIITIRRGLLGLGWTRRIACSDISDMTLKVGIQTGGASGTPYYDIQLICRDGRKRTAVRQIRNKREAVWLMNQMKPAIGL